VGIVEQSNQILQFYIIDVKNPLVKRMKRLVRTSLASTNIVELWNLSSEVEGEVRTNYGDEDDMEGDDEREDDEGNVCKEAPNDLDICIRHPLGLASNTLRRSDRLRSTPTAVLEENE
jgi:hypothetical protein